MEDRIQEELKTCPRCRSKARLITAEKDKRRQTNKIECTKKPCIEITMAAMCGVNTIIKVWNTRSRDEEIKKILDNIILRLNDEIDFIDDETYSIVTSIIKNALKEGE